MNGVVMSVGLEGMKGHKVSVEANVRVEKDQFVIVGLPDASIKESNERMLSCIHALDEETCILASLSLGGKLVPFHGLIPSIQQAIQLNFKRIIIPAIDVSFIQRTEGMELIPIDNIEQLLSYLSGQLTFTLPEVNGIKTTALEERTIEHVTDFSAIRGHNNAKRALEIAAAGGHHVLLNGPPGCGKSMLADAFHTILPNVTNEEMLEVFSI